MSLCSTPPPLENDDLLLEILIRLPPLPSSIPRASLVCARWRRVLSDPGFLRRFRRRHGRPPLLGVFEVEPGTEPEAIFRSVLDPPDRIPASRFSMPVPSPPRAGSGWGWTPWALLAASLRRGFSFLGCRHGLALLLDRSRRQALVVWDPITAHQRRVPLPPAFNDFFVRSAAVLCASGDGDGHVHGDCGFSPFKLVVVYHGAEPARAFACLYESESGEWGNVVSTATTEVISMERPSVLAGSALCWLLHGGSILQFDLERKDLAVIARPADAHVPEADDVDWSFQILRGMDNGLGLAILSKSNMSIQLWERESDCDDGAVEWVSRIPVQLDELFSLRPRKNSKMVLMPGYDEDTNLIFLSIDDDDFMLQLEPMQLKYLSKRDYKSFRTYCPYTNFCTSGRSVGGRGGAENVNT